MIKSKKREEKFAFTYPKGTLAETKKPIDAIMKLWEEERGLTEHDLLWVKLLVDAYDLFNRACRDIRETGMLITYGKSGEYKKQNPSIGIRDKAFNQVVSLIREAGLTPRSRKRLDAGETSAKDLAGDPLATFLGA